MQKIKSIVAGLVKDGVINDDDAPVAEFVLEYMARGRDAVNTEQRQQWYENMKSGGCVDEQGRLRAAGDIDVFQLLLWILCAQGFIEMR